MAKLIVYPQIIIAQIAAANTSVPIDVQIDQRYEHLVGIQIYSPDESVRDLLLSIKFDSVVMVDEQQIFQSGYQARNLYSDATVSPNARYKRIHAPLKIGRTQSKFEASIRCPKTVTTPFDVVLELLLADECPPWATDPYALLCC